MPPDAGVDETMPGFGPFGTAGVHCFDAGHPVYRRIAALAAVRRRFPVLRVGRQYPRQLSLFEGPFIFHGAGEIVPWSRILFDEETLCIVNAHGNDPRGGAVLVDASLNPPGHAFTVAANSAESARGNAAGVSHPIGSEVPVRRAADGTAFVEIRNVPPSEVLVLVNRT